MNSKYRHSSRSPSRKWTVPLLFVLVAGSCFVVMNVRGLATPDSRVYINQQTNKPEILRTYEHGWPWISMHSDIEEARASADIKSKSNWSFSAMQLKIHWWALMCNTLVACGIIVLVCGFSLYRWGSKARFRFSLLDIGFVTLLASLFAANFQYHRSVSKSERELSLLDRSRIRDSRWCGPGWLRPLLGEHHWMKDYWHAGHVIFENDTESDLDEFAAQFPFAREITVRGDLSLKQIESFANLPFETLRIEIVDHALRVPSTYGRFGIYDSVREIVLERKERATANSGEGHESRIKTAIVELPQIRELSIDASRDVKNRWPRALDLVKCCPSLKSVSLEGPQFLVEDLMDLPTSVESVSFGWLASNEDNAKLKGKYPGAEVSLGPSGWNMLDTRSAAWQRVENLVNRRRRKGWEDSELSTLCLDLSFTQVDREFLENLRPVFADVHKIKFGMFDSQDTAIWLTQQCPSLSVLDASDYQFNCEDAMKLPVGLETLTIKQGALTYVEVLELIRKLKPRILELRSSTLNEDQIETIRAEAPLCNFETLQQRSSGKH